MSHSVGEICVEFLPILCAGEVVLALRLQGVPLAEWIGGEAHRRPGPHLGF